MTVHCCCTFPFASTVLFLLFSLSMSLSKHWCITGCAVAQHCCKGDQPFQWETPKFDPSYFPNPLIFPHQNLHRWLCPAYLLLCKIWWKSFTGGFPTNRWNITLAWLFVPFLPFPFIFLPSSTGKTTEPILTHDGSYDAVSRKEVPFGGYKILIQHFHLFFSQKYEKLQWRLWGKLDNALNCHNSGYV